MRSMRAANSSPATLTACVFFERNHFEMPAAPSRPRATRARGARGARARARRSGPRAPAPSPRPRLPGSIAARDIPLERRGILQQAPQVLHQLVHQLAALRGVEAVGGLLELLGREALAREGAERARRLVGEDLGAAADLFRRDRGRYAILAESSRSSRAKITSRNLGKAGTSTFFSGTPAISGLGASSRSCSFSIEREHHFACGLLPAVGDAPVERERGLGARLGDAGACCCARAAGTDWGALFSGQASSVRPLTQRWSNADARRLEQAEHLDRRVGGLGLEQRVGADASSGSKCSARKASPETRSRLAKARRAPRATWPAPGTRPSRARARRGSRPRRAAPRNAAPTRPASSARTGRLAQREELLEPRRAGRRCAPRTAISFGSDDRGAELVAQPRVELRARAELPLGAADERRADDALLASSKESCLCESARTDKASATTGYCTRGIPIEMLNGIARSRGPGRLNPGRMTREKTRTTSRRRFSRSGTTTPMRAAPASSRALAHARRGLELLLRRVGTPGARHARPSFQAGTPRPACRASRRRRGTPSSAAAGCRRRRRRPSSAASSSGRHSSSRSGRRAASTLAGGLLRVLRQPRLRKRRASSLPCPGRMRQALDEVPGVAAFRRGAVDDEQARCRRRPAARSPPPAPA